MESKTEMKLWNWHKKHNLSNVLDVINTFVKQFSFILELCTLKFIKKSWNYHKEIFFDTNTAFFDSKAK